jgi:hypothetical protein
MFFFYLFVCLFLEALVLENHHRPVWLFQYFCWLESAEQFAFSLCRHVEVRAIRFVIVWWEGKKAQIFVFVRFVFLLGKQFMSRVCESNFSPSLFAAAPKKWISHIILLIASTKLLFLSSTCSIKVLSQQNVFVFGPHNLFCGVTNSIFSVLFCQYLGTENPSGLLVLHFNLPFLFLFFLTLHIQH